MKKKNNEKVVNKITYFHYIKEEYPQVDKTHEDMYIGEAVDIEL